MFDIVKKKWIFLTISIVLVVGSILSLIFKGFNLDIDFAGGMTVTYTINNDEVTVADVQAITSEALGADKAPASVQTSEGNDVIIKFGFDNDLKTEEERSQYATEKINAITAALEERYNDKTETSEPAPSASAEPEVTPAAEGEGTEQPASAEGAEGAAESAETVQPNVVKKSEDVVSPSTGQDLARSALWMSLLAAVAILIYVSFRFEFISGVTAVVALAHDVIILLGIYSIFGLNVNISYIAAVLTVLGYSINNTIVIFDRIRENTRRAKKESYSEIANTSVWQTMNRSINTTITTLLTIGLVYILGVPSIQEFSLPIIIGILIGAYSSIFVSGTIWAMWRDSAVKSKGKGGAAKSAKA